MDITRMDVYGATYILQPTMLGCCANAVYVSGATVTLFVTPG